MGFKNVSLAYGRNMRFYLCALLFCASLKLAVADVPVGTISAYAGASAPAGWLTCNGSSYSASTYPDLYAVLGVTTVPDLRGRFPLGGSSGFGTTGGVSSVTLTIDQIPSHFHSWPERIYGDGSSGWSYRISGGQINANVQLSQSVGGGQPHTNMPPYLVVNYIIKALPDTVVDESDLFEVILWGVKIKLWIMGVLCALICALCFFARR